MKRFYLLCVLLFVLTLTASPVFADVMSIREYVWYRYSPLIVALAVAVVLVAAALVIRAIVKKKRGEGKKK